MALAYLGLGANLGDREANIRSALDALDSTPGLTVRRVSTLRETTFVGTGPSQPDFLNGVAELECALSAEALLDLCLELERTVGRDRSCDRAGPRPLDLDVLLFGDQHIDTKHLIVPHPRMQDRAFVLEPLRELGVEPPGSEAAELPTRLDDAAALHSLHRHWLRGGCTVGLVPTMGALHAGHASLLERARDECDRVTVTVFVNPMQFDAAADLDAYPRDLDRDLAICADCGVDAVFAPRASSMYSADFVSRVAVGVEAEGMEGAHRPGHFEGVATVVAKLLVMARADRAYFGEKDAQQLAVVRRLVTDLGVGTEIRACEIVRESDGLAMSSRNRRLSAVDRMAATVLHRALLHTRDAYQGGELLVEKLRALGRDRLALEPRCELDYFELRDGARLATFSRASIEPAQAHPRALVAARFGDVRLIDNLWL